jgi:hypothetical protein
MKTVSLVGVVTALVLSLPAGVHAQTISYTATDVSGSTWDYNYTITNNTTSTINEFTIFATLGQYSNLSVASSASSFNSVVAQPDPGIPADGYFDAQANSAGLSAGATLSGFSMQFNYLGSGTPGSQLFNIIDPNTYNTLAAGYTTAGSITTQVPEIDSGSAGSAVTFLLGSLIVLRARTASERKQHRDSGRP